MDKHDALDYFLRLRNEVLTRKDILPAVNFGAVDVAVECIEMEIARAEHRSADVIRALNGLECCMARPGSCHQCDYYPDNECTETLLRDVRALIEGEPRVMTLEDIIGKKVIECKWVDDEAEEAQCDLEELPLNAVVDIDGYEGRREATKCVEFDAGIDPEANEWLPLNEYGKTWRCWTSRPTDAQRKAVKWE